MDDGVLHDLKIQFELQEMKMKLKELMKIAMVDTLFNPDDIESIITRSSTNYQKWVGFQVEANIEHERIDVEFQQIKRGVMTYYREDFPREFKNNSEFESYVYSDDKLKVITEKKIVSLEKCKYIEATVKNLHGMGFTVKNHIEWTKYVNGF